MKTFKFLILAALILQLLACNELRYRKNNTSMTEIEVLTDSIQVLTEKNKILRNDYDKLKSEAALLKKKDEIYNEDFLSFIINFSENEVFQKDRIIFPITIEEAFIGFNDTTYIITSEKWDTQKYKFHPEGFNIYDNEEIELRKSNYRVLRWFGIESCGDLRFYFKGKNGKWFLYKISHNG